MIQNLLDAQLAGHGASVLPGRAAEGHQHIIARIGPFGDRDRRMALTMLALATCRKPSHSSIGVIKRLAGAVRRSAAEISSSRASTACAIERKGKRSGRIFPKNTFKSVTASGPPRP